MRKMLIIFAIFLMVVVLAGAVSAAADTTAPVPVSGDPARDAVNVPVDKVITTTFSEDIESGSGGNILLFKSGGTPVAISSSINGKVLTVTPTSPLEKATKYTLVLQTGSVQDISGNPCAFYTRPFTTDSTGPKATAGSPARNAVNVPVNTDITTTFNEPINFGNMNIQIQGGSVPFSVGIVGNVFTIHPTTSLQKATKYTVIFQPGSLTDLAGNPIAYYSRSFTTDSTAPQAIAGSPARNAVNVPVDAVITTTFNEDIITPTKQFRLVKPGNVNVPGDFDIIGNVIVFIPDSPLEKATTYTLILEAGSLTDRAGNAIAYYSRSFTTDSTAPQAIAGSPARNAVNVPVDAVITTTFNEPIKDGAGAIQLLDGAMNVVAITHSINGNVLTVIPTGPLSSFTHYVLLLDTDSITDLAGNGIDIYSRGFTTVLTY